MCIQFQAIQIAKFFLGTVDKSSGDNITHLKLQKLLYYSQGFHLALHDGKVLFPDEILAWRHGPVIKSIYREYRACSWQAISPPNHFDIEDYPPEVRELLETVNSVYGQFTANGLEQKTHQEPPWKNTPANGVISQELLRQFFSTLVEAGRTGDSIGMEPVWPTNSLVFQKRRSLSDRMERNRETLRSVALKFQGVASPDAE